MTRTSATARLTMLRITPSMPIVYQRHPMECGLACISMLTAHYGHPVSMTKLRREFDVGSLGLSINGLLKVMDALGHKAVAVDCTLSDLAELAVPAIVHLYPGHYVVLRRITPTKADILDPAAGRFRISTAKLAETYSGSAIVVFPAEGRLPLSPHYLTFRF
jgi:ABC-type bacteriocin/lantibiotic exporter with double-glycine peptidase domain